MTPLDFTTTLSLDQTPKEAFDAINNVRGWWSEEIEGGTDKLHDEFAYHYEDVHYCRMKLVEVVPDKKVVWLVLDNHFNFTKDASEWKGTTICFEISQADGKSLIRFTHVGLVPAYECFDLCRDAWTNYIQNSLRGLIMTGKGQPNPKGGRNSYQEGVSKKMDAQGFHIRIVADATAHDAFKAINGVSRWWTENVVGSSQKLKDEFTVRFGDIHYSRQKLVEVVPDKKVVWLITDSKLSWLKVKNEWTNTRIAFEISRKGDQTQVDFTHIGLVPAIECYPDCSNAWSQYIEGSLQSLIATGKGKPDHK